MSLMQLYFALPFALPIASAALAYPYNAWKSWNAPPTPAWDAKDPMVNFARICNTKREALSRSIGPKQIYRQIPTLTQKTLGVKTFTEANAQINAFAEGGALVTGALVAAIPIVKFFGSCLKSADLGTCAATTARDLFSYSSFQLLAGAYLVSRVAKLFVFNMAAVTLMDISHPMRVAPLYLEYMKIQKALTDILDQPVENTKFQETALLAKQFLRIAPTIEKELHETLSIDRIVAKGLLIPLTTVCRQIDLKNSLAQQAPPPKLLGPLKTEGQDNAAKGA